MIKERSIPMSIILTIITCGIYGIYWFIVVTDEAKLASGDNTSASGGLAFVLTLVTCGLYGYYWAYKLGQNISTARMHNGMNSEDYSIIFIILQVFGLSLITYAIAQNDLNAIANKNGNVQ